VPKRKSKAVAVAIEPSQAGGLGGFIAAYPRECVAGLLGAVAVVTIFVNALYMQKGPHPAPIFATRPAAIAAAQKPIIVPPAPPAALPPSPVMQAPVAAPAAAPAPAASQPLNRVQTIAEIQRELTRRGYYEGVADGIWGAKTDAGARDFAQAAGVKVDPNAPEDLLRALTASKAVAAPVPQPARRDQIAELLAPSPRVVAIQRALADFGYGQIKPSGTIDAATRAAIEKFERDHRMPVTGQVSDRFVRELSTMAGRPLE
jgi:peptidoglycan hydrolase-like protein with peptidoglycan-binding domain